MKVPSCMRTGWLHCSAASITSLSRSQRQLRCLPTGLLGLDVATVVPSALPELARLTRLEALRLRSEFDEFPTDAFPNLRRLLLTSAGKAWDVRASFLDIFSSCLQELRTGREIGLQPHSSSIASSFTLTSSHLAAFSSTRFTSHWRDCGARRGLKPSAFGLCFGQRVTWFGSGCRVSQTCRKLTSASAMVWTMPWVSPCCVCSRVCLIIETGGFVPLVSSCTTLPLYTRLHGCALVRTRSGGGHGEDSGAGGPLSAPCVRGDPRADDRTVANVGRHAEPGGVEDVGEPGTVPSAWHGEVWC